MSQNWNVPRTTADGSASADRLLAERLEAVNEQELVSLLRRMVAAPSVSGQERPMAELLRVELQRLGFRTQLQPVGGDRCNVYAEQPMNGDGRVLMFNGHIDTVAACAGWSTPPLQLVKHSDRLHGLGACDMKGGLAAIVVALGLLVELREKLKGMVSFSAVVDEEAHSLGAKALLEAHIPKPDAIIIGEPHFGDATSPLPLGMTGKALYEIRIRGRAAHAFEPERGANAINAAARIVLALEQLQRLTHPQFGQGSLCALTIHGGPEQYSLVVPDDCTILVNRLLVPGEHPDAVAVEVREAIEALRLPVSAEVAVRPPLYDPYEMTGREEIVQAVSSAYTRIVGHPPSYSYQATVGDANVFSAAGIPTVCVGPRGGGIHEANEFVASGSLVDAARIYALAAVDFLRRP